MNRVPDAALAGSLLLAYVLDRYVPIAEVIPPALGAVGWAVLAAGAILALYGISVIRSNNATSNVTAVPPALMTRGLYAHSRNPLYLSYLIITAGTALVLGSLAGLVAPVLCWAVLRLLVIPAEERALQRAFGQQYLQYRRSVRRWL